MRFAATRSSSIHPPPPPPAVLRAGLLAGIAILVAVHIPGLWPHGRLWAEEGTVYLAGAWNVPWYLGLVTIHTGYLNLVASGATTLALHLVALEYVPVATVLMALLIQITPAILLTIGGIRWLHDWRLLVLALLVILLPPFADEVWLNTITSPFHIMLAVAIILASPPGWGAAGWFQWTVLVLAPLSGPGGAVLLPLYCLRAWLDRSPARLMQALLLLPGAAIQVLVVLTHPEPARTVGLNLAMVLGAITGKQILLPLFGFRMAARLMRDLVGGFAAGHVPLLAVAAPVVAFGTLGVAAWWSRNAETRWLFAASMLIMTVSYLAALTPEGPGQLLAVDFGNRYYFVPAALTGLTVLGVAANGPPISRFLARVTVAWLLLVGSISYFQMLRPMMADGPSWPAEVARWRLEPTRPIAIWPADWWVTLQNDGTRMQAQ